MQDNDIVLCDGDCNRGYHEQCLQPRIHAGQLPEDEGWLCPACDAKVTHFVQSRISHATQVAACIMLCICWADLIFLSLHAGLADVTLQRELPED